MNYTDLTLHSNTGYSLFVRAVTRLSDKQACDITSCHMTYTEMRNPAADSQLFCQPRIHSHPISHLAANFLSDPSRHLNQSMESLFLPVTIRSHNGSWPLRSSQTKAQGPSNNAAKHLTLIWVKVNQILNRPIISELSDCNSLLLQVWVSVRGRLHVIRDFHLVRVRMSSWSGRNIVSRVARCMMAVCGRVLTKWAAICPLVGSLHFPSGLAT